MVLLCLCSCKDKASVFVLEGNVGRLTHDTISIYGADALYEHIDTVVAADGIFRYTAEVDTVTPLWVLFPNNHREMLFADKGLKVTMQGDTASTGHVRIVGGAEKSATIFIGLPLAREQSGTSLSTTVPADTIAFLPIVTPLKIIAPSAIQAPSLIITGETLDSTTFLKCGYGLVWATMLTPLTIETLSSIYTYSGYALSNLQY